MARDQELYPAFLADIKDRIRRARVKAALSVNRELIVLYWSIGKDIVQRQYSQGWGRAIVDRLAADLQREFPGLAGFSPSNIWRMRAFYLAWPDGFLAQAARESAGSILPPPVAEIPWFHNVILLQRIKDPLQRIWYAEQTLKYGWSRNVLIQQISSRLYERQGKAVTNFKATLPPFQSDLAEQAVKDPYVFDFLALTPAAQERELESGLISHVQRFLLELGKGFAFVGRQVRLEVAGEEYRIDLLFYHLQLRCYVVIEFKAGEFKPEYALRDLGKPIGIADWKPSRGEALPKKLRGTLPSVKELEKELRRAGGD
ncbi:MAG: PDDEXK nuclease domain-containing protein [Elusimicrobiota bacterium]|jgi:predicted nuclease of restriction endonuclease-like (RecB) superfamily